MKTKIVASIVSLFALSSSAFAGLETLQHSGATLSPIVTVAAGDVVEFFGWAQNGATAGGLNMTVGSSTYSYSLNQITGIVIKGPLTFRMFGGVSGFQGLVSYRVVPDTAYASIVGDRNPGGMLASARNKNLSKSEGDREVEVANSSIADKPGS